MYLVKRLIVIAAVCAQSIGLAQAGVSKEEADRLKGDLTPLGAIRAGNSDGTIPEWTGKLVAIPENYGGPGSHYPDPFSDDKVLFTITAENVDQYADKLTPGQLGLFKTYPDTFKMNIYQTRRSAVYPEWYYENTYEAAQKAELEADGNGVLNVQAALPFPIPKNGLEALWNHLLRFQGIYRVFGFDQVTPTVSGNYIIDRTVHYDYFPYYDPDWKGDPNMLFMFIASQEAPPKVAGDQFLFQDYVNPSKYPRNVWRYFAGQRRVRRAPVFVYDTPIPPSYGHRPIDSFDMFFGSPDKFEWELKGKKEIYIAYNSYKMSSPEHYSVKDLVRAGHINPEAPRYELHRVWVVEGTLKEGERHIYSKRTFYIDEDSWTIAVADQYDERGNLWRVNVSHLKLYYDVPTTYTALEVHHDLIDRRYNALPFVNDDDKDIDFSQPSPPESFFTPASIRRLGRR